MIEFGSVCSGIEAASVAWHPLGWRAAWLAEIEPFPCAVLAHHYPEVPNHGNMLALPEMIRAGLTKAPDVFTGGTPCQAFSVAGKRESLGDARGNLSLTFCEIADAIDDVRHTDGQESCVVVWENVPGVLSTSDNAFGCFLGALAGAGCELRAAGGRWSDAGVVLGPRRTVAWRILDAQYFGLAQRRRRVFVVASARNGFDPGTVLLEFDGVRRDSAPRREAGEGSAGGPGAGAAFGGNDTRGNIDVSTALGAHVQRQDFESETFVVPCAGAVVARAGRNGGSSNADLDAGHLIAHTLRGEGFDASEDGTGRGTPLVPVAFDTTQITSAANYSNPQPGDPCHPLAAGAHAPAIAFAHAETMPTLRAGAPNGGPGHGARSGDSKDEYIVPVAVAVAPTITASNDPSRSPQSSEVTAQVQAVHGATMQVRRLTPTECERLQGFPDGYTLIPWRKKPADACPDGPRYKALGNSWAVPCARWIGRRIDAQLRGEHG